MIVENGCCRLSLRQSLDQPTNGLALREAAETEFPSSSYGRIATASSLGETQDERFKKSEIYLALKLSTPARSPLKYPFDTTASLWNISTYPDTLICSISPQT